MSSWTKFRDTLLNNIKKDAKEQAQEMLIDCVLEKLEKNNKKEIVKNERVDKDKG